jgi:hypothetical protein
VIRFGCTEQPETESERHFLEVSFRETVLDKTRVYVG